MVSSVGGDIPDIIKRVDVPRCVSGEVPRAGFYDWYGSHKVITGPSKKTSVFELEEAEFK